MIKGLVEHLEQYVGRIEGAEAFSKSESSPKIKVLSYEDVPTRPWGAYTTLGLSDHVLSSGNSRGMRMELVTFWDFETRKDWDPGLVLATVAGNCLESHAAVTLGDVIPLPQAIAPGSELDHVYVILPFLLPEEFETFHGLDESVIFPLLLPVTTAEAQFIRSNDKYAFEDYLDVRDVPILNPLRRSSI